MRIVDARARPPIPHFFGQKMYSVPARTLRNIQARGYQPVPSIEAKSETLFLDEVKKAGVSKVIVATRSRIVGRDLGADDLLDNGPGSGSAKAPEAFEPSMLEDAFRFRDANRDVVELAAAPDALLGEAASREVVELKKRGVKAIVVEPGDVLQPARYLDDLELNPLYATCSELEIPLYIMGGGNAGPDLSFSNPVALDRVSVRFPKLQLVAVHGGWPWVQEILGTAFRRHNVWVMPDFYFPGCPGESDYLLAIRGYLQDRFLFATGFPFAPHAQHIQRFEALGLPANIFEKIMGANAARLLGL